MAVELNHTIVAAHDKHATAEFFAHILGLKVKPQYGPFVPVETSNGVLLDFLDTDDDPIPSQHYAFLVSEDGFDAIFAQIQQAAITYYADPGHHQPGQINHLDGAAAPTSPTRTGTTSRSSPAPTAAGSDPQHRHRAVCRHTMPQSEPGCPRPRA